MALKDWKKNQATIEGNFLFINKKDDGFRISIFRNYPSKTFKVMVFMAIHDKEKEKHFKTKSAALKYARAYMRTH